MRGLLCSHDGNAGRKFHEKGKLAEFRRKAPATIQAEPFSNDGVDILMMILALAALVGSNTTAADAALQLCRPALERKAGGELETLEASTQRRSGRGWIFEGQLTASVGMGPPQPGSASAHHLVRSDFDFRCRTAHGKVRDTSVTPRQ